MVYKFIYDRRLDTQEGNSYGGAQELNTVPYFTVKDDQGITYSKVYNFIYPVDEKGRTILMQDVKYYSNRALSNALLKWQKGGQASSGKFNTSAAACFMAPIEVRPISCEQTDEKNS